MKRILLSTILAPLLFSCSGERHKENHQIIPVNKSRSEIVLDGSAREASWDEQQWYTLDQNWLGDTYDFEDFSGRYKLLWDEEALYLYVEITDDMLYDQYSDPLKLWWDDDCLEIFVDEDNSGGLHQYNHNAFAYHVALDGNVVDLGPDREPHLYNEHVRSSRKEVGNTTSWEVAVALYADDFTEGGKHSPVDLKADKQIGFALAYCDNDGSKERENFIGSVFVPGTDKNQGWINADIFGTLLLKD